VTTGHDVPHAMPDDDRGAEDGGELAEGAGSRHCVRGVASPQSRRGD
jgi:hypothetical protein